MFLPTVILLVAVHLPGAFLANDCMEYDSAIVQGKGAGKVYDVLSAQDCRVHCQMTDECNAFIWNDADHKRNPNVCGMKKGFTEKGMKAAEHRHSGPKVYWNTPLRFDLFFFLVTAIHSFLTPSYIY